MQIKENITPAILAAATGMLQPFVPELSPQSLVAALTSHNSGDKENVTEKPLTRKECAALLGVSLNSINRYAKQGRIRAKKISKRLVRIDPKSVRDLLNCSKEDVAI